MWRKMSAFKEVLMIAALAVATVCFVPSTSAAQNCTAVPTSDGITNQPGQIYAWGMTTLTPQGTSECGVENYRARVESWIWGKGPNRNCTDGSSYDSGRGACVREVGGSAKAGEAYSDYGLWDAQHKHFFITQWDGQWYQVDVTFSMTDGGTRPDGHYEEDLCTELGGIWFDGLCSFGSPILIPLTNSQSHKLTGLKDGVYFDHDGDGVLEKTGWTAPNSRLAFLAIDRNGNGTIDNGTELFGNNTYAGVSNGFDALRRMLVENGGALAGAIRAGDPLYDKLLLWEDSNHNGVSEPYELRPAKEVVTQVGLGYSDHQRRDGHGNRFRYKGWAELRTTGPGQGRSQTPKEFETRRRDVYDVFFVISR